MSDKPTFSKRQRFARFMAHFLFWSWNAIFIAFVVLGFAPTLLPDLLRSIRTGEVPLVFPLMAVVLTAIPVAATLLGYFFLRKQPFKLLAFGYGVEGPLMLLLIIRFFILRQLTPPMILLFVMTIIGLFTLCWVLLDKKIEDRGVAATAMRLFGVTLLLLVGLYLAIWFAFYALPLGIAAIRAVGDFFLNFARNITDFWNALTTRPAEGAFFIPFTLLGGLLLGYTLTLLIGLPVAVVLIYSRAWQQALAAWRTRVGRRSGLVLSGVLAVGFVSAFMLLNQQPQEHAFALLAEPPASPDAVAQLLASEDALRRGLVNAYLAPARYVSAEGDVRHISDMYQWALDAPYSTQYDTVTALYEGVAQPVLYKPVETQDTRPPFMADREKSAELYRRYFDRPITEGEKDAITRAARSTWNVQQAVNNWQQVDDREILLTEQEIAVTENGAWAEIELHEVYANQTFMRQEVLYYFSLPESAVVTGIWLGNSADKDDAFAYRVAPRGAAQAVYQAEVQRRVDPALVEQLGPTQYRLRAFPIEPRTSRWNLDTNQHTEKDGPPLHMWLTYRVMAAEEGWALPQLSLLRNVYWDKSTERTLNGTAVAGDAAQWLPAFVSAENTPPTLFPWQRVDFANGQSVLVRSATLDDALALPPETRLAVVLDRSRSMQPYADEVTAALDQLRDLAVPTDVYLTASEFSNETPTRTTIDQVDGAEIVYLGGQNSAELLQQFEQLRETETYDAILVITDDTGYELGEAAVTAPHLDAPTWMVHLGGYPLGYDDDTLEAIQASGGGSVAHLDDALTRIASGLVDQRSTVDIVDGYVWRVMATEEVDKMSAIVQADELAPFAARRLILSEMVRQRDQLDQVEALDQLHAIAVENSIVTPYSSMIVLVNDRQQRLLDNLEENADRFERELEPVDDTLGLPITGVPEPHEYLLMALAGLGLIWYWRRTSKLKTFAS